GNGEDTYGFAAFPSGTGNNSGNFSSAGNIAYWWSSSEINAKGARFRSMRYNYAIIHANDLEKTGLFSVRCVKD
ncbi:MAG: hypothetical protein LBU89_08405, partial [Fibromonadaceae bacterium]|nr:hypothetical protein [Fibromonadaceae bacterium]